jgi:iron-sulfur cluster repair di-iron protein
VDAAPSNRPAPNAISTLPLSSPNSAHSSPPPRPTGRRWNPPSSSTTSSPPITATCKELPRLAALTDKVVGVHGTHHPELHSVKVTFTALRDDLEPHLMKEEQVLFPMIRDLADATTAPTFHCGSVANPIRMMLLEHDRAGELLAELRDITNEFQSPEDGCASYHALYGGLAEMGPTPTSTSTKNNVLFPPSWPSKT